MKRTDIINTFIQKYGYKSYLEVGTQDPTSNFDKINVEHKVSIDPFPRGEVTFVGTSDEYFESIADDVKYDIIFIDGLHHSEQVDIDIENSLKQTNNNGIVILHDCNPPTLEHTLIPRVQPQWNGDVYKSILKFRKNNKNHEYFTVDCDWGVGVIMFSLD